MSMTPGRDSLLKGRFGPTALITGASDGIGRAFAARLAEQGFDLILVARREAALQDLALELGDRFGARVTVVAMDLTEPGAVPRLLARMESAPIGLVVAAAGYGSLGPFVQQDIAQEAAMVDLNCRSVVELVHGVAGRMVDRGQGGIVLFGSLVGFSGAPWSATYAATKGFVQSFAEGIAAELRPRGVHVLSVAPGPVGTGFAARAGMRMGRSADPVMVARVSLDALGRRGTVRPGGLAKMLGWSLALLPRQARARVLGSIMRGMTMSRDAKTRD